MLKSTFQYDFKDLKFDINQIQKILGYQEGKSDEITSELLTEVLKESEKICTIKAEYRVFNNLKFIEKDKSVLIMNQCFDIKRTVYRQLKESDSILVFLCTAGNEIGIRSREEMKEGNFLKGYLFDVVGSGIVESAADLMQNEVEINFSKTGKKLTNRFSPGYCGWNVVEQHKLFSLMPDNSCGIQLTESALMDPIKSISGFIGIGNKVKQLPYVCSFCDMKDCVYRRKA